MDGGTVVPPHIFDVIQITSFDWDPLSSCPSTIAMPSCALTYRVHKPRRRRNEERGAVHTVILEVHQDVFRAESALLQVDEYGLRRIDDHLIFRRSWAAPSHVWDHI